MRSRCLNIEIITLPSLARFSYRTFPAIMVPAQVPTGVGFLTFEWGAHSASVFTISRADVSKDYNLLGMGKSICASLLFIHTYARTHVGIPSWHLLCYKDVLLHSDMNSLAGVRLLTNRLLLYGWYRLIVGLQFSAFVELRCVILKATIPPPWVTRGWRAGLCCASATWTAWSEEFEEFSYCVALCSTQDATVSPWRLLEKQRLLQSGKNPLPKWVPGVPWAENDLETL